MTLRRNILSLLIWISIVAVFVTHVILTRKKNEVKTISERSITEVKTTILKRTESENIHINKRKDNTVDLHSSDADISKKEVRHFTTLKKPSNISNENAGLNIDETNIEKLKKEIGRLKKENGDLRTSFTVLAEKEKNLKTLARRLASKLKSKDGGTLPKLDPLLPWIFCITPTYTRYTQKADLVRLSQTLLHITNLHWIIVEDSKYRTDLVGKLLIESGLSFTHLNIQTPQTMRRKRGEKYNKHHRGVVQRNLALQWIRENVNINKTPGVIYFMDDDNTYHRKLFDEMRTVKHVGVWPVALAGGLRFAGPKCSNGKVNGFHVRWGQDRSFPIDMAGFAINLKVLVKDHPDVVFESTAKRGYLEPTFLEQLTTINELEGMGSNCTKVLVWHTRTETPKESLKGEREMIRLGKPSDPNVET